MLMNTCVTTNEYFTSTSAISYYHCFGVVALLKGIDLRISSVKVLIYFSSQTRQFSFKCTWHMLDRCIETYVVIYLVLASVITYITYIHTYTLLVLASVATNLHTSVLLRTSTHNILFMSATLYYVCTICTSDMKKWIFSYLLIAKLKIMNRNILIF